MIMASREMHEQTQRQSIFDDDDDFENDDGVNVEGVTTMMGITRNQCRVSHTLSISTRREAERKMLQIKQKQVSLSSVIAVYFFSHLFLSLSEFTLIHTIPNPKKQKLRNTQAVVNAERTSYRQQELGARQDFTSEYLYRVVLFNTFRAM